MYMYMGDEGDVSTALAKVEEMWHNELIGMFIYMSVCMYLYVCIYVNVCVCIYLYMYVYIYICIWVMKGMYLQL
jgi:hypothetical protein